jgi:hypothetical protein
VQIAQILIVQTHSIVTLTVFVKKNLIFCICLIKSYRIDASDVEGGGKESKTKG